jgi:sortase A
MKKNIAKTRKTSNYSYYLGNLLIALSMISLVLTFYPLIQIYLFPPKTVASASNEIPQGFYITIPKIAASSPIIANVDPWQESIYNEALKRGVAHAKGTAIPGQEGTIFLFAHSSGMPWELTRYNTIFLRLGDLQREDLIKVFNDGKEYTYEVTGKKEVWPHEVNYLLEHEKNQLILQTCTPIGTSLKRLLVFAEEER